MNGFIGSYTKKDGKGIYYFEINKEEKSINKVETGYEVQASTYVKRHGDFLYGIKREDDRCGVQAYNIEPDGKLTVINDCLHSNETGCHIWVSEDNRFLFEAVYGSGQIRLYELNPNTGALVRFIGNHQQEGNGPNKERQDNAHTHYIQETHDGYAVAVDLGTDEVITFSYNEDGFEQVKVLNIAAGSGPRHLTFNQNNQYAYLFTELSNEIIVLSYNNGEFKVLNTYSTLNTDFKGHSQGAAIRMSHDNQYVYVSNRGENTIAVFKVIEEGADLKFVQNIPSGGDWPRDFNISNDDAFLVCAHEADGHLVLFERNKETGKLTEVDNQLKASEGVCVEFI